MRSHRFTMVELLAVCANILLIAAVVIPVVNHAAGTASDTGCRDNLKKIGEFTAKYTADHQDAYPVGVKSGKDTWFSCMKPYIEKELLGNGKKFIDPIRSSSSEVADDFGGIFRCPEDSFRKEKATSKSAYALSYALHGNVGNSGATGVAKTSDVKNPAEKAYRMDCTYTKKPNGFVNLNNFNWILGLNARKRRQNGEIAFRHGKLESNVLMLDGHVAPLAAQESVKAAPQMLLLK